MTVSPLFDINKTIVKQGDTFSATNGQHLRLKIVSDIHLGYKHADKDSFNRFLDTLQSDKKTTDLVLLGDIVDMWRRDAAGVFLENWDIVEKLMKLKQKMRIHYVAGNHDYHVLQMRNHSYPFNFVKDLKFIDGKYTYVITHGLEFDPQQKTAFMEALCHVMYDPIETFEDLFGGVTQPPEKRLSDILQDVEHIARSKIKEDEMLVFGHTHHPFINDAENVVNTGCWVTDSTVHNTVVEISNGKPKLYVFEGHEITERTKI